MFHLMMLTLIWRLIPSGLAEQQSVNDTSSLPSVQLVTGTPTVTLTEHVNSGDLISSRRRVLPELNDTMLEVQLENVTLPESNIDGAHFEALFVRRFLFLINKCT